ncbi:hypothetical protein [Ornithobacterium rhinotracheale]|uniref:hypothetical protein n=1 Tax=Ornithobacterium rhinotracheale TaxID=28251 RepID=UPI0040365F66
MKLNSKYFRIRTVLFVSYLLVMFLGGWGFNLMIAQFQPKEKLNHLNLVFEKAQRIYAINKRDTIEYLAIFSQKVPYVIRLQNIDEIKRFRDITPGDTLSIYYSQGPSMLLDLDDVKELKVKNKTIVNFQNRRKIDREIMILCFIGMFVFTTFFVLSYKTYMDELYEKDMKRRRENRFLLLIDWFTEV